MIPQRPECITCPEDLAVENWYRSREEVYAPAMPLYTSSRIGDPWGTTCQFGDSEELPQTEWNDRYAKKWRELTDLS